METGTRSICALLYNNFIFNLKTLGEYPMKKIIAIAAILASTQSFAFFDDQNTSSQFINNGKADVVGNGTGEGEATFGMTFEGTGSTSGKLTGNGNTNGAANGLASDDVDTSGRANGVADAAANGRGEGNGSGSAKFSMNFAARAKGNGDFRGNGVMDNNNGFQSASTPYYYAPEAK